MIKIYSIICLPAAALDSDLYPRLTHPTRSDVDGENQF